MRLDSPKAKRAGGWIAAFALPIAIVQIVGWMSGGGAGPSQAGASAPAHERTSSPIEDSLRRIAIAEGTRRRLSAADQALSDHAAWLRTTHFGPTPMLHAQPPTDTAVPQIVEVDEPRQTFLADDDVPSFQLHAVMSARGSAGARALINGHVTEIGKPVAGTAWIAVDINAEARRVVLEHAVTKRTAIVTLKFPQ